MLALLVGAAVLFVVMRRKRTRRARESYENEMANAVWVEVASPHSDAEAGTEEDVAREL